MFEGTIIAKPLAIVEKFTSGQLVLVDYWEYQKIQIIQRMEYPWIYVNDPDKTKEFEIPTTIENLSIPIIQVKVPKYVLLNPFDKECSPEVQDGYTIRHHPIHKDDWKFILDKFLIGNNVKFYLQDIYARIVYEQKVFTKEQMDEKDGEIESLKNQLKESKLQNERLK